MVYCEQDINLCDIYAPDYIISVKRYSDNFKWTPWFKARKLKGFIYAFYYKNVLFKIGCSYNNFQTKKNTNWGDRVVRQFTNLPGRLKLPPKNNKKAENKFIEGYGFVPASPNGENMILHIQDLEQELGVKIDRNDIFVHIWNITNVTSHKYGFPSDDKGNKRKAEYFEGLLIKQYKDDNNGKLPLANKKHDPSLKNRAFTKPKLAIEAKKLFVM